MAPRLITATALLLTLAGTLSAADPADKDIQRAIKAGRDYLHACYKPGGPGPGGFGAGGLPGAVIAPAIIGSGTNAGPAALAGLALLESGATANDAAVANIAKQARDVAFAAAGTYEISLLIMFLDKLGNKEDTPLIQLLTLRLMSGQLSEGSWSYTCDGLKFDAVLERQIRADLKDSKLVTGDGGLRPAPTKKPGTSRREDLDDPKPKKKDPIPEPKPEEQKKPEPSGLHPALEKFIREAPPPVASGFGGLNGDHSNTQFATVGLWCGRRHFVDVTIALGRIDDYYRRRQGPDGGWAYNQAGGPSTPAMTCAGLMGLALGFGAKNLPDGATKPPRVADPDALNKDRKVMDALQFVGSFLSAAGQMHDPRGGHQSNDLTRNLYFMWSLERVGMVYGLETIGKVNWYDWGSAILTRTQQRDGSWASDGFASGGVDSATAFALLFLSRANLTGDLSASLKGKVKDPGTSRLIGGRDLPDLLKGGAGSTGSAASKRPGTGATPPTPPMPPPLPTPPTDSPRPRVDTPRPKADSPVPKNVEAPAVSEKDPLASALISAGAADRADLLAKYRDTRGIQYTDALARAAAKMTGEAQAQTREALAERLTRMTPATLVGLMADPDRELRRAAALACGAKGKDRLAEFAEPLIKLIGDDEAMVVQSARASLKALTEQDFGPESAGSVADREKALAAWRKWWADQNK